MKQILVGIILLSLVGCLNPEKSSDKVLAPEEFNITALLEEQITLLLESRAQYDKTVLLNGLTEQKIIQPGNANDWNKELALFISADISDPALFDNYDLNEPTKTELRAELKEGISSKVKLFVVRRDQNGIEEVEAVLSDDPVLFKTGKKLNMTFDKKSGLLNSYSVSGFQKMLTRDSVTYSIKAKRIN